MAKRSSRRDPAKERHWRRVIRRWENSGQTVTGFCQESKLSMPAFQWWRRELARREGRSMRLLKKRRQTTSSICSTTR